VRQKRINPSVTRTKSTINDAKRDPANLRHKVPCEKSGGVKGTSGEKGGSCSKNSEAGNKKTVLFRKQRKRANWGGGGRERARPEIKTTGKQKEVRKVAGKKDCVTVRLAKGGGQNRQNGGRGEKEDPWRADGRGIGTQIKKILR